MKQTRALPHISTGLQHDCSQPTPDKPICDNLHPGLAMLEKALAVSYIQISRVKGAGFHCDWSCLFQG